MTSSLYVIVQYAAVVLSLVQLGSCGDAGTGTGRSADAHVGTSPDLVGRGADGAGDVGSSSDREAETLLDCMEADGEFTQRLGSVNFSSQFLRCATDADCTEWWPRLECVDNGALISPCTGPVAFSQKELAAKWLRDTEADLCPRIQPRCRASGDCVSREPRCLKERCALQPLTTPN